MKRTPDEMVDQALTSLGKIQPPGEMKQRILKRLAYREELASPRKPWSFRFISGSTWQFVGGGFLLILLGGTVVNTRLLHSGPSTADVNQETASLGLLQTISPPTQKLHNASSRSVQEPLLARRQLSATEIQNQPRTRHTVLPDGLDDMHAPSMPAPQLPLTTQEKLLRRVVHGDPEEITALDPVVQASIADDEKLAFKKFFAPSHPTPIDDSTEETDEPN